jgi:hypothetical protein
MRRIVLVAVIAISLSTPVSAGLLVQVAPAYAVSGMTCTKVSGYFDGTLKVRRCAVPPADVHGYGSASVVASTLVSGGTLTWAKSGATTILGPATITSVGRGRCGKYETEQDITATVTGGTAAVTAAGDTFSADVCVYMTSPGYMSTMTKLVKGTTATI